MVAGVVIGLGAVMRVLAANSASYSSSYRAGEVVGTICVVIAAGCLFLWGVRRMRPSE
jgi:hypothetical protein